MDQEMLRMPEVARRTGLSVATIYRMVKAGKFPAQVGLGKRAVGWRRDEVEHWLGSRQPRLGPNAK